MILMMKFVKNLAVIVYMQTTMKIKVLGNEIKDRTQIKLRLVRKRSLKKIKVIIIIRMLFKKLCKLIMVTHRLMMNLQNFQTNKGITIKRVMARVEKRRKTRIKTKRKENMFDLKIEDPNPEKMAKKVKMSQK